MSRCERCRKAIKKGKRFCHPCAVEYAKELNLDDILEPDDDEDTAVLEYRRRKQVDTWIAIGVMALVFTIALWALLGGGVHGAR